MRSKGGLLYRVVVSIMSLATWSCRPQKIVPVAIEMYYTQRRLISFRFCRICPVKNSVLKLNTFCKHFTMKNKWFVQESSIYMNIFRFLHNFLWSCCIVFKTALLRFAQDLRPIRWLITWCSFWGGMYSSRGSGAAFGTSCGCSLSFYVKIKRYGPYVRANVH